VFIELTDLLRCPEPHEEQFLVLLPDQMQGRSVRSGQLGCPVCHREYLIVDGVPVLGMSAVVKQDRTTAITPDAIAAFLGLAGPGGYVGVVGEPPGLDGGLVESLPGIHVAAVNPPEGTAELPMMSVVRGGIIPLKSRSLRGVVLAEGYGDDPYWVGEAIRVVLPGLRITGAGPAPEREDLEVLAAAGGWWVGMKR
jgi:uncharacterized protein YbaR (Trm112 family)